MKSSQDRRQNSRQNGQRRAPVQFKQFETSGPGGKFKGVPKQIIEKYLQYARDYATAGDNIKAETCKQYAEHYLRLLGAAQQQSPRGHEDKQPEVRRRKKTNNKDNEPQEAPVVGAIQDASEQPQPKVEDVPPPQAMKQQPNNAKNAPSEENVEAPKPKRRGRPPKKIAKTAEE